MIKKKDAFLKRPSFFFKVVLRELKPSTRMDRGSHSSNNSDLRDRFNCFGKVAKSGNGELTEVVLGGIWFAFQNRINCFAVLGEIWVAFQHRCNHVVKVAKSGNGELTEVVLGRRG